MRYLKTYENFSLNEGRVPRSERVELYRDDNIIVVVPLTHRALQKYANKCQWCINSDVSEWEDYHKGKHTVIIQRNPKKPQIGITGKPMATEIFFIAKWDNNESDFEDVCQMLDYEFRSDRSMTNYYLGISRDIKNFATDVVYYSPSGSIYDMEDNNLYNFKKENGEDFSISDIPNVTPEVIGIMDEYLKKEDSVMESMQNEISDILSLFDEFDGEISVTKLKSHYRQEVGENVKGISIRPTNPYTTLETTKRINNAEWSLHSENDVYERIVDLCSTLEERGHKVWLEGFTCKVEVVSIIADPYTEKWFQEKIYGRGVDWKETLEFMRKDWPNGFFEIEIIWR
jgi:hypothetical protein